MRLALVGPGYPPAAGGVEVVVAQTARALVRAGVQVEVLAPQAGPAGSGVTEDAGVLVRRFAATRSRTYPLAPGLWRYLHRRRDRYDVVHAHSYHTLAAAGAALVTAGPFVFSPHYHGTGHSPLRAALHRVYRPAGATVFRRADAVVCVSAAEAALVRQHFPDTAERTVVIPNAVDAAAIHAAAPFGGQPPTVLSVGRLERYKGVDRLLAAFARLGGDAQLVVLGDGPDRQRLAALARRSPAADRIRLLGRVGDGDLRRWLRTARVLCSLSAHEAFGLAPAEARAAGARLVLSAIPAHAELAGTGDVRLVSPGAGDTAVAAALAEALAAPLRGPVRAPGWDEIAAALLDLYTGLGHRAGSPRSQRGSQAPAATR